MIWRNFFLLLIIFFIHKAAGDDFVEFKRHYHSKEYSKALTSINEQAHKGFRNFGLGLAHYQNAEYQQTIDKLDIAYGEKINLDDYIYFYEGVSYLNLNKYKNAEFLLKKVIKMKPESSKKNEAKFYLAESLIKRNKLREARKHLVHLERSMRNNRNFYPKVLWGLTGIDTKQKSAWRACRWAKRLYTKYPTHELIDNWDIDFSKIKVEDIPLRCNVSLDDKRKRIKRFQYEGFSKRAREEIALLENKKSEFELDILLANYLVQDGFVKEAYDLLSKHYGENTQYHYLNLLATIQSRLGSHEESTQTYDYISTTRVSRRLKEKALFNSAFVNFQSGQYNLASNKFANLITRTKNKHLTRKAQWYKYWANYLGGNYESALEGFDRIITNRGQDERKIKYYSALSYLKTDRAEEAKQILKELSNNSHDFYSLAAASRLEGLKKVRFFSFSSLGGGSRTLSSNNIEDNTVHTSVVLADDKLKNRFERANNLESLGFYDLAKEELYFIEKSSVDKDNLRLLMAHYNKINAFNRASYVGEIYLEEDMGHSPVATNRGIWQNTYPKAYEEHVLDVSDKFNVEKELIWAIMKTESNYRKDAISPVGAMGLMQIMPYTGQKIALMLSMPSFESQQLQDPALNIKFAARYLQRLLKQFDNNIALASAAYNAGPHRIHRWLGNFNSLHMDEFIDHIPFKQTRGYVKKVIKHYNIYKVLYSKKINNNALAFLSKPIEIKSSSKSIYKEDWSDVNNLSASKKQTKLINSNNTFAFDNR